MAGARSRQVIDFDSAASARRSEGSKPGRESPRRPDRGLVVAQRAAPRPTLCIEYSQRQAREDSVIAWRAPSPRTDLHQFVGLHM
jgi:hypothetical protein